MFWGYEYLAYLEVVISKLEEIQPQSVIDVGCGDGRLLYEAKSRLPGTAFFGVDYSKRSLAFARAFNPDVSFVCADILEGVPDRRGEVVTAVEVLEHIRPQDFAQFVHGIHLLLKDSGILIATVPSDNVPVPSKHYRHFTVESLKKELSPYFEVTEHIYLNKSSVGQRLIARLLTNRVFILNHRGFAGWLYRQYRKRYIIADERSAKRLCVVCKKTRIEK